MEAQRFSNSDLADKETAIKVGEISGSTHILLALINRWGDSGKEYYSEKVTEKLIRLIDLEIVAVSISSKKN